MNREKIREELKKLFPSEYHFDEDYDKIINYFFETLDFELAMKEDYTHGEEGKEITNLRKVIQKLLK